MDEIKRIERAISLPRPDHTIGERGHTTDHNLIAEALEYLMDAVANGGGGGGGGGGGIGEVGPAGPAGPAGPPGPPGSNFIIVNDLSNIPEGTPAGTVVVLASAVMGNQPPVAVFGYTSTGLTVSVDGSLSYSLDNTAITQYSWDFGDGTTAQGSHASHTYAQSGNYNIRLVITDVRGYVDYTVRSIYIEQSAASAPPTLVGSRATYLGSSASLFDVKAPVGLTILPGDYLIVYMRGQSSSGISTDIGMPQDWRRIGSPFSIPDSTIRFNGWFAKRAGVGEGSSFIFNRPAGDTSRWTAVFMVVRGVDTNPLVSYTSFAAHSGVSGTVVCSPRINSLILYAWATETSANNSGALSSITDGHNLVEYISSNLGASVSNSWVHVYSRTVTTELSSASTVLTLLGPSVSGYNSGALVLRGI